MLSRGLCAILDVDGPCCNQANLVMYRRVSKIGIVYPKLEKQSVANNIIGWLRLCDDWLVGRWYHWATTGWIGTSNGSHGTKEPSPGNLTISSQFHSQHCRRMSGVKLQAVHGWIRLIMNLNEWCWWSLKASMCCLSSFCELWIEVGECWVLMPEHVSFKRYNMWWYKWRSTYVGIIHAGNLLSVIVDGTISVVCIAPV